MPAFITLWHHRDRSMAFDSNALLEDLFDNRPWQLGGPSRWLLCLGAALVFAAAAMATTVLVHGSKVFVGLLISGLFAVAGLQRIAIGCESLVATHDRLQFYGWFGLPWREVRPADITEVGVAAVDAGTMISLRLSGGDVEHVLGDHYLADWLDDHSVFVPDFGSWRGKHGRGHPVDR
jgi:hypothetical protein